MRYEHIDKELFINNRQRFIQHLPPKSIAIFHSNDLMPRNGDAFFKLKQRSDFFHLSGIDQEESMLIIFPDAPERRGKPYYS
jgi:Xaa-Pro aminopeptidase